jgi:hypothetical protein
MGAHRERGAMDGPAFARFMRSFLPTARRAPFNYVAVFGMVVAPTVAGLALTFAGPLLVSRFITEPHYDVILAWDPDAIPPDWEAGRAKYFALNWVRALATWMAFALFLAALVEVT